ncbi:MAG: hypothetical protein HQK88_07435 [Nitrospirae bacterium]|nr:hypothetical protein [Nitrospirota bacterium]MBF0616635.1 hypothetical protein [Nitrospirota bacterium]
MSVKKVPLTAAAAFEAFSKALEEFDEVRAERKNCWEYYDCGVEKSRKCSAFTKSAGRRCWLVVGTLSGSEPECERAKQLKSCKECTFYQKIKKGEI